MHNHNIGSVHNGDGSICRKYRRYVADIDISVSVSYRHFIYRFFRYIDIVSMTSEVLVIFRYFVILFHTYMSKTDYLI